MAEYTLLKFEIDGDSFTATAPFGKTDGGDGDEAPDADDEDSRALLPFLVGFGFLLVVALAARRLAGGTGEREGELAPNSDTEH